MKKIGKLFLYFSFIIIGFVIVGCGNDTSTSSNSTNKTPNVNTSSETVSTSSSSSNLDLVEEINKLKFNDLEVTYDGAEHSIYVEGNVPSFVTVSYVNNNKVNAGVYEVSALFTDTTGEYQSLPTLEATLTINKKKLDVTFNNLEVEYDGKEHSIYIKEELPNGVSVTYSNNNQSKVGNYEVVAHITDTTGNYDVPSEIKAELTITKAKLKIEFKDQVFSYDGKEHSIYIKEELPNGVSVTYSNNNQSKVGTYEVVAHITDTTGNYDVPSEIKATLTIVKDGKFHDLTINYVDGTSESKVVENGYIINELKDLPKEGHTNKYINKANGEVIELPYTVTSDLVIEGIYVANTYKVNYCYNGEIIYSEEVTYNSEYTLLNTYLNNEGERLFKLIIDNKEYPLGSSFIYEYINDLLIEMEFKVVIPHDYSYIVTDEEITITGYTGEDTDLVIPEYIFDDNDLKWYKVVSIGESAFEENERLISVVLPDGITNIGEYAFYFCRSLISVNLPNSLVSIGTHAFTYTILESLIIPGSIETLGNSFSTISTLRSVVILDGVKNIGYGAFNNCTSLTSVILPSTLKSIGQYAFTGCAFSKIIIPEGVTSIEGSAFGCKNLVNVKLPNTLLSIGEEAFSYCGKLSNVVIPSSVIEMGRFIFDHCYNATIYCEAESIKEGWDKNWAGYLGSTPIYGAKTKFFDNFQYVIGEGNAIVINYFGEEKEIEITNNIEVEGKIYTVNSIGKSTFYESQLENIILPSSLESIGERAFAYCYNLLNIDIPSSVSLIGLGAFSECINLESIEIPEGVTTLENTFSNCKNLINVKLPNTLLSIGEMAFDKCENLSNINIPSSVSLIGNAAFSRCINLESIEIPEGVTTLEGTFQNCKNLINVKLPSTLESIGDYVFQNCSSLESIIIPESVEVIGIRCFEYCTSLVSVSMPTTLTSIGYYAFENCEKLESIEIPEGITILDMYTFAYCSSLEIVKLPSTLTTIETLVFFECINLKSINLPSSLEYIGYGALACKNAVFYIEAESIPSIWGKNWNAYNRPVYLAGEWEYIEGVPTPLE